MVLKIILSVYNLDDLSNANDLDLENLLDEKSYEDIFLYHLRCNVPYNTKPMDIIFDKINWSIKDYYWSKYLILIPSNEKRTL